MVHGCFHQTLWLPMLFLTRCGIDFSNALFLQFALNTLLRLYHSFTPKKTLIKQISLVSAFGHGFFGTVTKPMMTAIIKPSNFNSDSDDSDTPSPSRHKSRNNKFKPHKCKPNIKSKLLNLKHKKTMQRSKIPN